MATTHPASRTAVEAWFGLEWDRPTIISRVTAHPRLRRSDTTYLATSLVLEYEVAGRWVPIPGTDRTANTASRVDFTFTPLSVQRLRLRVRSQRPDERGAFYRASVLEIEARR